MVSVLEIETKELNCHLVSIHCTIQGWIRDAN